MNVEIVSLEFQELQQLVREWFFSVRVDTKGLEPHVRKVLIEKSHLRRELYFDTLSC
jgi:hypothetical protein